MQPSHKPESPQALYEAKDLKRRVDAMAQEVVAQVASKNPILVASRQGSLFFLTDLLRAFPESVEYRLINPVSPTEPDLALSHPADYKDRTVVVVRDLVTTGVVDGLLKVSFETIGAKEVLFVSLLDIPSERRAPFTPQHSVLTIGRDGILVGYGLKYKGHYGNLPYLGQVQPISSAEE